MESVAFDLIEEFQSQDISGPPHRSVNHSRLIHRISVALDRYDAEYDIFPELELELSTGKCKPDISIFRNLPIDWLNDIIFYNHPPIIAIEILSPKQALTDLTQKAFDLYFPSGVQVVWIVQPSVRMIIVLTPDGKRLTFADTALIDPVTGFELELSSIFRN